MGHCTCQDPPDMGGTSVCVSRTQVPGAEDSSWAVTRGLQQPGPCAPASLARSSPGQGPSRKSICRIKPFPGGLGPLGDLSTATHGAQEGSGSLLTRSALGCTGPTAPLREMAQHPQQGQKQAPSIPSWPGSPGLSCGGQSRDSQTRPQGESSHPQQTLTSVPRGHLLGPATCTPRTLTQLRTRVSWFGHMRSSQNMARGVQCLIRHV